MRGATTSKVTDSSGRTTEIVTLPDGTVNTYVYDKNGNLIRHIEQSKGRSYKKTSTSREYNNNVEIILGSDGSETTRYYDKDGNLVREIIRYGNNNI